MARKPTESRTLSIGDYDVRVYLYEDGALRFGWKAPTKTAFVIEQAWVLGGGANPWLNVVVSPKGEVDRG